MEPATDRGRLLYQEEWAKTRKYHDRSHIVMGIFLIASTVALGAVMGWAFLSGGVKNAGSAGLMIAVVVGMLGFMSFGMLAGELRRVPFKIYEHGFTLPNVSLSKGLRREGDFVGWERLDGVRLEEQVFMTINIRKIVLAYDGSKTLDLSMGLLEEPFAAMKALDRLVPAKMDVKFKAYLGTDEERKVVKYPLPEGSGRNWNWVMPVIMQLLITVMIGTFGWSMFVGGRWIGAAFFGGFMLGMSGFFFGLLLMTDGQAQTELLKKRAAAGEYGVGFPTTFVTRLTRQTRPVIPFSEIRVIRTVLEPMFFSHLAEVETFNGERFKVPYGVYEAASRRKEFRYEYFEQTNNGPALPAGRLMPRSLTGTIGLFILFLSPALLVPLISIDLSGPMEVVQPLILLVTFSVLLPLLSFSMRMISRRQMLGEGLVATKERITITGAPSKFQEIGRSDFLSARIARDVWTLHCEISTVHGRVKVGHSAADKLILAGYPVEGAENLQPLASLAPADRAMTAPEDRKPMHSRLEPGRLLAEQDPASVAALRRKFYMWGVPLTIIGAALLAVPFFFDFEMPTMLNLMIITLLPLLIGPVFIYAAGKMRPARIHDNGLMFADASRPDGFVFVPYGRIKGYADMTAPLVGGAVRLQIENGFYTLPKSFPGFNALFEGMKEKFGKPDYDSSDFQQHTNKTFRTLELLVLAAAISAGYLGAAMFASMNGYFIPRSFLGKTLMYGAPVVLLVLAYGLHFLELRKHNYPGKADLRKAGALFSAALVLFGAGWAINVPDPDRVTYYAREIPGSWAALNGSVENRTLELRENISVQPGERLVIRNSTICFPLAKLKEFRFYVSEGGWLEVTDSLIRSNSSEFGLKFSIYGGALLQNSTFTGLYASPWYKNGVGGLEIFNSSVSVINCSVVDNACNGILLGRCSPLIENCNISGNGDDGIEMQDSSPVIRGCRLSKNDWAMVIHPFCSPRIENNTIENNDHGIVMEGASPVIANNTFTGNRAFAIKYYDDSSPDIRGNSLALNEDGVVVGTSMETYFAICATIVLAVSIVVFAVVLARVRRKRLSEQP